MEIPRMPRISSTFISSQYQSLLSEHQVITYCVCASSHELWVCAINYMTKLLESYYCRVIELR